MLFFLKLFNNYHGVNVDPTFGLQKKKKRNVKWLKMEAILLIVIFSVPL